MHTVVVSGTNLSGRPDSGDTIDLFNMDVPDRYGLGDFGDNFFYHGTARFSVPAGHYYAIADFCCSGGAEHVVIVPQFTVSAIAGSTTTVHVSERSASSLVSFTTAHPAVLQDARFQILRLAANGGGFDDSWGFGGRFAFVQSFWVSPTTAKPTVGSLQSETQATLTSPSAARGTPYSYQLDYPGPLRTRSRASTSSPARRTWPRFTISSIRTRRARDIGARSAASSFPTAYLT